MARRGSASHADSGLQGVCCWWKLAVLLTAAMVITTPLEAHGRHSLAGSKRHHHHHHSNNQSSVSVMAKESTLSDDSAERDHLIGLGGAGPPEHHLTNPGHRGHHRSHKDPAAGAVTAHVDFEDDAAAQGEELTAGGGAGPVADQQPGNVGANAALLSDDDVMAAAFHSPAHDDTLPSDDPADWPKVPVPQKQRSGGGGGGGGDPTAWTLSDFYDYLAPDDDLSAADSTPEPEPSPSPPPSMEDENPLLAGSAPDNTKAASPSGGGGAGQGRDSFSPGGGGGGGGASLPAVTPDKGQGQGAALGPDGCMLGMVRSGSGVCVSQCDLDPNYCYNGGVCTMVAGAGAFCRCNVQEYIWNKGVRCDWMVTEFQVLCVLVGVSVVVLLLLFMIIVFFSKRLHRLKNENRRLRKRSKYRPQSGEPQTDGMSLSTTADGSQPNDDPQKQHPQEEEPVKTPPVKEEESMNIRNSHSPKQENNRPMSVNMDLGGHTPTEDNQEVNSLQNNLV